MITFDVPVWQVLGLAVSVVFPLLVGLVTKRETNPGRKAVFLAGLAFLSQLAAEAGEALQHNTAYNLGTGLLFGLGSFLIAVGTHYGFWKPTGVADKAQAALDPSNPMDRVPDGPDHSA